jgi:hypothetical protein
MDTPCTPISEWGFELVNKENESLDREMICMHIKRENPQRRVLCNMC